MRHTKIICTLGPACTEQAVMESMLRAGMNVARLNFSHGTHAMHEQNIVTFRAARDRLGLPAAVLLDTRGPEIRTDAALSAFEVRPGDTVTYTPSPDPADLHAIPLTYPALARYIAVGDRVLIDDGKIATRVTKTEGEKVVATVEYGGLIRPYKGVNLPGVALDLPFLSEKDKEDLRFGVKMDVDFVAASFTRTAADIREMRAFLRDAGGSSIRIIAKIENQQGIENFDAILEEADGIMVARGDMGVEVPFARLPGLQKSMIDRCRRAGKPSVTATQMLESMVTSPNPTRAEVSDVANAVFDGTSVVMLSGETAAGNYPVEAVRTMATILDQAERDRPDDRKETVHDRRNVTTAICDAACATARDLGAAAIVVVTRGGITARACSAFRPKMPILALTPEEKTYHQLALSHSVVPLRSSYQNSTDDLFRLALDLVKKSGYVRPGDFVVLTAGLPIGLSGSTNVIKVETVD